MPKRRRRSRVPTPSWDREHGAIGRRFTRHGGRFYGTAGIVLLVVASVALVAYGFLSDWRADYLRPGSTALRVGETKYTVEYFTERLRKHVAEAGGIQSADGQPSAAIPGVVEQLTKEAIVLKFGEERGATASEDEIRTAIALQLNIAADAPDFDSRYQSDLAESGVSEGQYRDEIRASVLSDKLLEKFRSDLPASAESVHYRQIVVSSAAEADEIKTQVEGGADFAQLAKDKSVDTTTKEMGGDNGWAPRGLLETEIEDLLFALDPGAMAKHSAPDGGTVLFQVIEKLADRPIDEAQKPELAESEFRTWREEKAGTLEIVDNMDFENGDKDKIGYAIERAYPSA